MSELSVFRDRYGIPAVGEALVTRDGVVELDLIGARVRGGDPVGARDAWHIGSCGKAMTAALYARLVERGEAEWGTPVAGAVRGPGGRARLARRDDRRPLRRRGGDARRTFPAPR